MYFAAFAWEEWALLLEARLVENWQNLLIDI